MGSDLQEPYFRVTPESKKRVISLGRNPDTEKCFEALVEKRFSQFARKYSGEVVSVVWEKIKDNRYRHSLFQSLRAEACDDDEGSIELSR